MAIILPSFEIHTILFLGHIFGTALGLGGATISDLLFFRATKDGRFEAKEWEIMKLLSKVIWVGITLAILSGVGFLLEYAMTPEKVGFLENDKIWAKMTIVGIIFLNGVFLHWKLFPIFESMVEGTKGVSKFPHRMTMVFTSGAISITSWYSVFIMGAWRGLNFTLSYWQIMLVYASILAFAIASANALGRWHTRKLVVTAKKKK
ncbi:MAG: hypothetical protein WDZ44_01545 [Candidatus Spechtbacterales bacterium]